MFVATPDGATLRDKYRRIPLHFAANRGRFDAIQLLVQVDPETLLLTDHEGTTTLKFARLGSAVAVLKRAVDGCDIAPSFKVCLHEVV